MNLGCKYSHSRDTLGIEVQDQSQNDLACPIMFDSLLVDLVSAMINLLVIACSLAVRLFG